MADGVGGGQIKRAIPITTLFLNIGGVLLTDCFVHLRKPDEDIFRLALDIAQTPARQIVYIENTPLFVQIAEGLGIQGILHTDYESTREKLSSFGLQLDERAIQEID